MQKYLFIRLLVLFVTIYRADSQEVFQGQNRCKMSIEEKSVQLGFEGSCLMMPVGSELSRVGVQ